MIIEPMEKLYREYSPSAGISGLVECYWCFRAGSSYFSGKRRPVTPDGCVDLIWSVDEPGCPCTLVGPMTAPFFNDSESLFGLRFRPFAPSFLLEIPMHGICDRAVAAADLPGTFITELSLYRPLFQFKPVETLIADLEYIIASHLHLVAPDAVKTITALTMLEAPGLQTVNEIAEAIGWSRQHLFRKCRELSGLSPKFIRQVFRLQRTIRNFDQRMDLTDQALLGGYYDQSHMIHEFNRLTSLSPSEFFSRGM